MIELALLALLGAGAFWNGLYSAGQQLAVTAALAVTLLLKGSGAALSRSEAAALLLLAAGAALSLMNPAAAGVAAHGPAILAGWFFAWAIGRRLADDDRFARLLGRLFALLGPLMIFGGIAAMSYLPPHHTGRLAAFLGYPIAVGVLGLVGLAGSLPWLAEERWWAPVLAYGNAVAVLLSGSRGVWAAAVLLALYFSWAAPHLLRRVPVPLAAALAAVLWAGPAVTQRATGLALAAFLLGSLTLVLLLGFPAARWQRWLWVAGTAAWLAALALAPGWPWFLGRATALPGTEGSSVERFWFMRDGLRLAARLPLGAGYRAWTALHLQGASYAYYSAEVHSALLDNAIAFGWVGAAGFLLLLSRFLLGLRHGRRWSPERVAILAGLGALALHALVDWDLSFGLFAVPLWFGFGLMAPGGRPASGAPPDATPGPLPAAAEAAPVLRIPFPALSLLAGLALASTIVLGAGDSFETLAEQAVAAGRPSLRPAAVAVAVTPWNDLAQAMEGQALQQAGRRDEALAAYQRARLLGPYEPWYAELQARTLMEAGRPRDAAAAWREYVHLWPWEVPAYEAALQAHLDMALRAAITGDHALARDLAESGRAILAELDAQKAKEPRVTPRAHINIDTPVIRQARDQFG